MTESTTPRCDALLEKWKWRDDDSPELDEAYTTLQDTERELAAARQSFSEEISMRALVHTLEGAAPNTDTCWQWRAASALRDFPGWQIATIKLPEAPK